MQRGAAVVPWGFVEREKCGKIGQTYWKSVGKTSKKVGKGWKRWKKRWKILG